MTVTGRAVAQWNFARQSTMNESAAAVVTAASSNAASRVPSCSATITRAAIVTHVAAIVRAPS